MDFQSYRSFDDTSLVGSPASGFSSPRSREAAELGAFENLPIARRLVQILLTKIPDTGMRDDFQRLVIEESLSGPKKNTISLYDDTFAAARRYTDAQKFSSFSQFYDKIGFLINLAGPICDTNITNEFQQRTNEALRKYNADNHDLKLPHLRADEVLRHSFESFLYPSDWTKSSKAARKIHDLNVEESIALHAQSAQEDVTTMHPNGSLTLPAMRSLRKIHALAVKFSQNPTEKNYYKLDHAISKYADPQFSLSPVHKNGHIRNSTVSEEGEIALDLLIQDLEAREKLYDRADSVWKKRYGIAYGPHQQLALTLNRLFGTWAGGNDIDGNANKAAVLMFETMLRENLIASERYLEKLNKISATGTLQPLKDKWSKVLSHSIHILQDQFQKLQDHKDETGAIAISGRDIYEMSKQAGLAYMPYGTIDEMSREFLKDLKLATRQSGLEANSLHMYRKIRDSGFALIQNEPRENSLVFREVMTSLLRGHRHPLLNGKKSYNDLTEDERIEVLSDLIKNEAELKRIVTNAYKKVADGSTNTGDLLALQILERLENAHRHKGLVQNILIAECKGADDIILVFALQKMVSAHADNGEQLRLHICPLPEDGDSLKKIVADIGTALKVPEYKQHVKALGNIIKIMQPNSDLGARLGPLAAIAGLADNHYRAEEAFGDEYRVEHHDGKGDSDSMRGGRRDRNARIYQFASQKHTKGTLQGAMDLLNLINIPSLWARKLENAFAYSAELILHNHKVVETSLEKFVIAAASRTNEEFRKRHLGDEARAFYASDLVNAKISNDVRNTVSRKSNRTGKAEDTDDYLDLTKPNLETMRAIGKSKLRGEANLVFTYGAMDVFVENMNKLYREDFAGIQDYVLGKARHMIRKRTINASDLFDEEKGLTPLALKVMYFDKRSPTFRGLVDFPLDGVVRSEPELLDHKMTEGTKAGMRGDNPDYRKIIHKEFIAAAKIALEIQAPEQVPQDPKLYEPTAANCTVWQDLAREHAIPLRITGEKHGFKVVGHALRDASIYNYRDDLQQGKTANDNIKQAWRRVWREIGTGMDAVYYGWKPNAAMRDARLILRREREHFLKPVA